MWVEWYIEVPYSPTPIRNKWTNPWEKGYLSHRRTAKAQMSFASAQSHQNLLCSLRQYMYMELEEASDKEPHLWSSSVTAHAHFSRSMTKPTIRHVRPAKSQISLGIRPVWSVSSICAQWVAKEPMFLHADSKDADQPGRMPRLIWVFAGRTGHFAGFIMLRLIWNNSKNTTLRSRFTLDGSNISYQDNISQYSFSTFANFRDISSLQISVADNCTSVLGVVSHGRTWHCIYPHSSIYTNPHQLERLCQHCYDSFTLSHAYQSLACKTAINTDFSELFSLKRIYVKYKNAILSLIDRFFHTWKD